MSDTIEMLTGWLYISVSDFVTDEKFSPALLLPSKVWIRSVGMFIVCSIDIRNIKNGTDDSKMKNAVCAAIAKMLSCIIFLWNGRYQLYTLVMSFIMSLYRLSSTGRHTRRG